MRFDSKPVPFRARAAIALAILLGAACLPALALLEGTVVDGQGRPVAGARVEIAGPSGLASTRTDSRGRFLLSVEPAPDLTVRVEAAGFALAERRILTVDPSPALRIELTPASVSEEVTVSGTRTESRLSDSAASVAVLSARDLARAPSPALDQTLRQIPGFTLFRRSDSRTANPTSQGVSLRGVGASGASRATVLDDGVPLNDPFGGWIFWGRVPRASLRRVEVLRGGASDLYGGSALAGAVTLVRREIPKALVRLESSYGSSNTPEVSLFAGARRGEWGLAGAIDLFRSDGYIPVEESRRGQVDREAASRHQTAELTVERSLPEGGRVFLRGSDFRESRENGTILQVNDARIRQLAAGGDWSGGWGSASARLYAMDESYHQTFSAVAPDRNTETLTRRQRVPARAFGLSAQLARPLGDHVLVAGVEARDARGSSEEEIPGVSGPSGTVEAGGREVAGALFLEDVLTLGSRAVVTAGARVDVWSERDGSRTTAGGRERFADRTETAVSPRLSALYRLGGSASLTAAAYRSFRAPTLNELYRSFRVGDTLTLANERLGPERLTGGEAGVLLAGSGVAFSARATVFWMEIEDTIANVTVETAPTLITRRRENLGRTRSRGLEVDGELRASGSLGLSVGYLFADSTVRRFSSDPDLEGHRVAQVPRHQATLAARLSLRGADLVVQGRFASSQYEDDRNSLRLGGYGVMDAFLGAPVGRGIQLFAAGENLLGRRVEIARTPVTSLGPPRLLRAGLRLSLGS